MFGSNRNPPERGRSSSTAVLIWNSVFKAVAVVDWFGVISRPKRYRSFCENIVIPLHLRSRNQLAPSAEPFCPTQPADARSVAGRTLRINSRSHSFNGREFD